MTTATLTADLAENLTSLAADYAAEGFVPLAVLARSLGVTVAEIAADVRALRSAGVLSLVAVGQPAAWADQYGPVSESCIEGEQEWYGAVRLR